jgi:hypothetical protein
MSALELVTLLTSTGVLSGGLAAAGWVLRTERRLMKLEVKAKIA